MLGQCAQSVPLEATLYGGGEGGGPSLGKRATFIIEQGAIMKTKQIFKVYHILLTRIVVFNQVLVSFSIIILYSSPGSTACGGGYYSKRCSVEESHLWGLVGYLLSSWISLTGL